MAVSKRKSGAPHAAVKRKKTASSAPTTDRVTRGMKRFAAVYAVLGTTELLEAILLKLPMFDLFVFQRVSLRFRDCIAKSPRLQERMWLRLRNCPPQQWVATGPRGNTVDTFSLVHNNNSAILHGPRWSPAQLCPIFRQEPGRSERLIALSPRIYFKHKAIRRSNGPYMPDIGSWRKLYVFDPPCADLRMHLVYNYLAPRRATVTAFEAKASMWFNLLEAGKIATADEQPHLLPIDRMQIGNLLDRAYIGGSITRRHLALPQDKVIRPRAGQTWDDHSSVCEILDELQQMYPGKFSFDAGASCIFAKGIVIPSAAEWQAVHCRAALSDGTDANAAVVGT
nr:hypothetical protein B0A51_09278 [Rachicladosporium sp. CCFEE 5018]